MISKKEFLFYWIFSWFWVVFFGEFLTSIISPILNDGAVAGFTLYPIQIMIFYVFANLILTFVIMKMSSRITYLFFFVYGGLIEWFVWGHPGPVAFVFFGLFYVFLYGVPYVITKRRYRKK